MSYRCLTSHCFTLGDLSFRAAQQHTIMMYVQRTNALLANLVFCENEEAGENIYKFAILNDLVFLRVLLFQPENLLLQAIYDLGSHGDCLERKPYCSKMVLRLRKDEG